MQINLYNTRTRKKEVFLPIQQGEVGLYCCGPTVYNFAHIGNLRTYVFEDLLRRTLELLGHQVTHVMNITDVGHLSSDGDEGEDKMIAGARARGMTVWQIAEMFTEAFFDDCARLNIKRPRVVCKATDHIGDMINLIKALEEKGFTYVADGNVYFDVSRFERYGELALLDRQDLKAGARVLVDQAKKNPQDFVLWFTKSKFADQAMVWDSPWGRGYPGWHIECSAMSKKYLGERFDIHCGGVDHIPVHHTNEIAQTEAATGVSPWVNVWMHAEFLLMNKEKMSKSSGSFATLKALEDQGYHALDYRFFCLQAQYRTQLSFSPEAMDAARTGRRNLVDRVAQLLRAALPDVVAPAPAPLPADDPLLADFIGAVADDLNLPRALAALNAVVKDAGLDGLQRLRAIEAMDRVLGLDLLALARQQLAKEATAAQSLVDDPEAGRIQALVDERTRARQSKDWARSDQIRAELTALGVTVLDSPQGSTWKRS